MCDIFKTFNKVQKCASFCKSVQKCGKERGSHKMIGVRQKWDGRQTSLFSTLKLCNQPPASHICRNTNTNTNTNTNKNTNTKHKHHCSQSWNSIIYLQLYTIPSTDLVAIFIKYSTHAFPYVCFNVWNRQCDKLHRTECTKENLFSFLVWLCYACYTYSVMTVLCMLWKLCGVVISVCKFPATVLCSSGYWHLLIEKKPFYRQADCLFGKTKLL